MEKENWRTILNELVAGDSVAFARVRRVSRQKLVAMRADDHRDEWEDVISEVATIVWLNARAGKIRNPDALPGFIRTATRRIFYAYLYKVAKRTDLMDPLDETGAASFWPPKEEAGPDTEEIWEQVERLPELQRRAIELKYGHGYTLIEAAEVMGVPLGNFKRFLALGLATLKKRMNEDQSDPPDRPSEHTSKGSATTRPSESTSPKGSTTTRPRDPSSSTDSATRADAGPEGPS